MGGFLPFQRPQHTRVGMVTARQQGLQAAELVIGMAGNGGALLVHRVQHLFGGRVFVCQTPGCFGMGARKVVFAGKPDADPLDGDVDERQHDVGGQAGLTDGLHLVFDGGLFRLVVDGLRLFRQIKRRPHAAVTLCRCFGAHVVDHLGFDAVEGG